MLREITLGQYYNAKSVIHDLDPRVKLLGTLLYIAAIFVVNGLAGYAVITIIFLSVVKLSNVPLKYIVRGIKAIVFILIITAFCNMFFFEGKSIIVKWHFITITLEGVKHAVSMAIRLILLILGTSILTLTTTSTDLTDALEKSLGFLKKVKVPVSEIALMMSIALRFIPILVEETNKIMKAQISRGADFEKGNIFQRIRNYVPIIVPLFVSAFRRADDLSMAMEARCYQPGAMRSKMYPLEYDDMDKTGYVVITGTFLVVVILKVVCRVNGLNQFWII